MWTVMGYTLTVLYNGQQRTCFRCKEVGHEVKDCPLESTRPRFNEEDFPDMVSDQKRNSVKTKTKNSETTATVSGKDDTLDRETSIQSEAVLGEENVETDKSLDYLREDPLERGSENEDDGNCLAEIDQEIIDEPQEHGLSQEIGTSEMKTATIQAEVHQVSMESDELTENEDMVSGNKLSHHEDTSVRPRESIPQEEHRCITDKGTGNWYTEQDGANKLKITLKKDQTQSMDVDHRSSTSDNETEKCPKKHKPC
ncbi:uncharacterized protein [Palaemon carinicauda]|uniref:uncharacterized protein n=1 Tax=Palaemon carinicauda TaxID=392227 RepID=UPI0035B5D212